MTYNDFKSGLYISHHLTYLKSILFIRFCQGKTEEATFVKAIILMVDAERILDKVESPVMVKVLCLQAQGYAQWEIAEALNISENAVSLHIHKFKRKYLNT